MAFFKITYVFRTVDAGWTEIFYDEGDSLDSFPGPNAAEKRAVLSPRGWGVTLLASKVTEEGGLRRSKIFPINEKAKYVGSPIVNYKDVSEVTAKMRLNFAGGGGRLLNIRGVPDIGVVPESTQASQPSAALEANMRDYLNFIKLAADPFLGKQLKPITESGYEWKDVTSLATDPDNDQWTKVTVSELSSPLAVGTNIYFKGIDKLQTPWITGFYRTVGEHSTTVFSIPTQYRYPTSPFSTKNVQFRIAAYDYPAITGGRFLRIGTRQTAGPFGLRRGARSRLKTR